MWRQFCRHCDKYQLFGIRRLVSVDNIDPGVLDIAWSCPSCRRENRFRTGASCPASEAVA